MQLELLSTPNWLKILITYLLIGWCTQLPGGLFRRYRPFRIVLDNYERHGARALLDIPFIWIPFTILLWPVPFLRVGLNWVALVLVTVGVVSSVVIIGYVTSVLGVILVVVLVGVFSVFLARPRRSI